MIRNTSLSLHNIVSVETSIARHPEGIEGNHQPYVAVTLRVQSADGSEMSIVLFSKWGSMEIEGLPS